jgi:endonuclease/exonuclease/phosphatase family metal-dependent hydrolase
LAKLIRQQHPDVIRLQEVSYFALLDPDTLTPTKVVDYLDILLKALRARGLGYKVAKKGNQQAIIHDVDVTLPRCLAVDTTTQPANCPGSPGLPQYDLLQYIDRDVILVSRKVGRVNADRQGQLRRYPADLGGRKHARFSRGYVIIEAAIGGKHHRFANIHLEVTGKELGFPPASYYQQTQASELIGKLDRKNPLPTIVPGDLNSSPEYEVEGPFSLYRQFADADYVDARDAPKMDDGKTCCRAEWLYIDNPMAQPLTDRIDYVFARNNAGPRPDAVGPILAKVVGADPAAATKSGLWPSDHVGVFASLNMSARHGWGWSSFGHR